MTTDTAPAPATITVRPVNDAERAADAEAGKPAHNCTATVETNTDGRATIGKSRMIHRATIVTYRNAYGDSVGRTVSVYCGAKRYRNTGGHSGTESVAPQRYDVECAKC